MEQFEMLRRIGFKLVSIADLISELEAKTTASAKKLLDRINSMNYYYVLVNGDQFTIYSEVGNHKYEYERIAKFLGKTYIQDTRAVSEAGLWEEWIKYTSPSKLNVIPSDMEDFKEEVPAEVKEITMKNDTNIKVPVKYQHGIDEIFKDDDGYWAYSKKGYKFDATECHTAHGYTVAETLSDIRSLTTCDCEECTATMYRIELFNLEKNEQIIKEVDKYNLDMIRRFVETLPHLKIVEMKQLNNLPSEEAKD